MSERREQSDGDGGLRRMRDSSLEITKEAIDELAAQTLELVADYFARLPELPVFPQTSADQLKERFNVELPVEAIAVERILDDCRAIIGASRHNGHPRFFGYVASPSTPVGAFADLLASALNANVTSWRSAPAAAEIEKTTLRWLSTLVGYGADAHGLLTSGGSLANLNALLVAHRSRAPEGQVSRRGLWSGSQPMTIYASDQVHMSIPKAADVLGLGREQVRLVKSDAQFRLDVRALREMIEADRARGLLPFCVVGNAGTVNTGAVDPLAETAEVAATYDLWFHVDGAYGALGSADERKRPLFEGLERADSVSLDPHKWLYAPVDCGCLLFRDPVMARRAFLTDDADYIKVHEETTDESFAFWDYGIELSRRFRALKIWMMLCYYGARRIRVAISDDNDLAAYLAERVRLAEDFELLAPVELSICCFRYVPPAVSAALLAAETAAERARLSAELDQLNAALMHRVQRGGRAYLSNVTLRGSYGLRACIVNFRTTRDDINQTLDIVREAAREIGEE
jgi:glutamate/tyrosine decarboxylase-like PLP-dependent enzyme